MFLLHTIPDVCYNWDTNSFVHKEETYSEEKQSSDEKQQKEQFTVVTEEEPDLESEFQYNVRGNISTTLIEDVEMRRLSSVYITVTDAKDVYVQEIAYQYDLSWNPMSFDGKIVLADVNYDGYNDVLISLGIFGNPAIQNYECFLWEADSGQYVQIPEFRILSGNSRLFNCRDESVKKRRTYGCLLP